LPARHSAGRAKPAVDRSMESLSIFAALLWRNHNRRGTASEDSSRTLRVYEGRGVAQEPISEAHAAQILAGTEGRLAGHSFEERLVEQIESRFDELSREMTDPEVIGDRERYADAGRAYRALEPAHALAVEYRDEGVRCNAILPSVIDTPANRSSMPNADHDKWVKPAEIAGVVSHLLAEDSAPTSGAAIPVYGRA